MGESIPDSHEHEREHCPAFDAFLDHKIREAQETEERVHIERLIKSFLPQNPLEHEMPYVRQIDDDDEPVFFDLYPVSYGEAQAAVYCRYDTYDDETETPVVDRIIPDRYPSRLTILLIPNEGDKADMDEFASVGFDPETGSINLDIEVPEVLSAEYHPAQIYSEVREIIQRSVSPETDWHPDSDR